MKNLASHGYIIGILCETSSCLFKSLLCGAFCHYSPKIILTNTVYLSQIPFDSCIPCFANGIASNLSTENKTFSFFLTPHYTNTDTVSPAIAFVMLSSFLARIIPKSVASHFQCHFPSIQRLCFTTKVIFLQIKSLVIPLFKFI